MSDSKTAAHDTPKAAPFQDLSAEIIRTVAKQPGDQVTCRHIVGDHYRCNWWQRQSSSGYDNPNMSGLLVTTSRIGKSEFLKVTSTESGLSIKSISVGQTKF